MRELISVNVRGEGLAHTVWKREEAAAYETARLAEWLGFEVEVVRWEQDATGRMRRAGAGRGH